ncbi:MAG: hypothetical protein EOO23_07335 [Comamonadaceae bacterium]|nr:MAG: hypothetical protein EOO23_07335 [Comamonadaceae bacterium]
MTEVKQRHLGGLHVAFLVTRNSSIEPLALARKTLEEQGTIVKVVGERRAPEGASADSPGSADLTFELARADDFDGVLVGGDAQALTHLEGQPDAARLLRGMKKEGKPVVLLDGDTEQQTGEFMALLAERTRDSVRGTPDGLPGAAATGG